MAECAKCGVQESERKPLYELRIPVSDEWWMMCDPCLDDMVEWIDADTNEGNTDE